MNEIIKTGSLFSNLNDFQLKAISQSNSIAIILAMIGFVAVTLGNFNSLSFHFTSFHYQLIAHFISLHFISISF